MIVYEPDYGGQNDRSHDQQSAGGVDAVEVVAEDIAQRAPDHDGDAAHCGGSPLEDMAFRAFFQNGLAQLQLPQQLNEHPREDERSDSADSESDQKTNHLLCPPACVVAALSPQSSRLSRQATTRSSKGTAMSPISWVCSWPLPAMSTVSPGFAS